MPELSLHRPPYPESDLLGVFSVGLLYQRSRHTSVSGPATAGFLLRMNHDDIRKDGT